ncbi:MAG: S1C family serine protease [Rhodoluna sp.]
MIEPNRQFLYTVTTAEASKPTLKQRIAASKKAITGTTALVVGALLSAGVGAGAGILAYEYIKSPSPIVVNNASSVTWVTAAVAAAEPSVVTISVTSTSSSGNGSGEFLTEDGYILTNNHVVTLDGSTSTGTIEVKTYDGKIYNAKLIGSDTTNDLAVIKIDGASSFTPITFADSDKVNVGDQVAAIGAPLGLSNTVTQGIISALNRTIQVQSSAVTNGSSGGLQLFNGQTSTSKANVINLDVLQTDAAINPGNSGGALINPHGQLIGVNCAIASAGSSLSGTAGSIGVGFAIPANTAKRIAQEIMKTGSASHGLLGAMVKDAASSGSGFTTGAAVDSVTVGGAAEKAGVKAGDIITKFNDRDITTSSELLAAVRQQPAGAKVQLTILRNGASSVITVTLGDAASLK